MRNGPDGPCLRRGYLKQEEELGEEMGTALLTHADCLTHVTPEGHPERVARLEHVLHALEPLVLNRVTAPMAAEDDILRVHPARYVEYLRKMRPESRFARLDADTWMSPGSLDAAWRAVRAVDMVMGGEAGNAFCAVRPPGHHAKAETPMGFCLFGNAAIGAKHALDFLGAERVAVLDFDVHHGNGTQALLEDDPRVLFVSSHQMPLWPGTGRAEDTGPHGTVMNMPLPPGSGGAEMRAAWGRAFDRVRGFGPDLIIVSAGFDAHAEDPLANLEWQTEDYRWIMEEICALADALCGGRIVSTLEGGYDLTALSASVKAQVEVMMKAAT